jgi:hypothetical protein
VKNTHEVYGYGFMKLHSWDKKWIITLRDTQTYS